MGSESKQFKEKILITSWIPELSIGAKDSERKSNGKWNVIGVYDEKNAFADGIMAKWLRGSSANEIFSFYCQSRVCGPLGCRPDRIEWSKHDPRLISSMNISGN